VRCFVAIPLPADVRVQAAVVQAALRRNAPAADVRWTAPASLHVTLRFLGDVAADRLPAVCEVVLAAAAAVPPPPLALAGVGAFPSPRRARALWLGVQDDTGSLVRVAEALERGIRALGFAPEERPFTAHVTLGRVRRPPRGADLRGAVAASAAATAGAWTPAAVVLYQSHLGQGGAVHEALAHGAFG
jgi:2'-5' RNA ligase